MTEAAGAIVDWHQSTFRSTIVSGWIKGNAVSENVLRKLGFEDDGVKVTLLCHGAPVKVMREERINMTETYRPVRESDFNPCRNRLQLGSGASIAVGLGRRRSAYASRSKPMPVMDLFGRYVGMIGTLVPLE